MRGGSIFGKATKVAMTHQGQLVYTRRGLFIYVLSKRVSCGIGDIPKVKNRLAKLLPAASLRFPINGDGDQDLGEYTGKFSRVWFARARHSVKARAPNSRALELYFLPTDWTGRGARRGRVATSSRSPTFTAGDRL